MLFFSELYRFKKWDHIMTAFDMLLLENEAYILYKSFWE